MYVFVCMWFLSIRFITLYRKKVSKIKQEFVLTSLQVFRLFDLSEFYLLLRPNVIKVWLSTNHTMSLEETKFIILIL